MKDCQYLFKKICRNFKNLKQGVGDSDLGAAHPRVPAQAASCRLRLSEWQAYMSHICSSSPHTPATPLFQVNHSAERLLTAFPKAFFKTNKLRSDAGERGTGKRGGYALRGASSAAGVGSE
jgi:hypothetical protein